MVKVATVWAGTQFVSSHSCFISTFDSITHLHPGGNMRNSSIGLFVLVYSCLGGHLVLLLRMCVTMAEKKCKLERKRERERERETQYTY